MCTSSLYASLEWWLALFLSLICWLWKFPFWMVIFIYFWGGYVTFRRMKHEAMQDIGEVDSPQIFVPSPMRISQRFIDLGNSSMSHLTTKMQKEVHEDFHKILLHPSVGRGSNSVVRKLMSTYHCFFSCPW